MLRIGITGGIGSGKTTIARIFELLKVPVYYADKAAKRLYETDHEMMLAIRDQFGDEVYTDNQLNRSALAAMVFHDPTKLELLNSIVHPRTIRDAELWMQKQDAPYVIKEAALIFESSSASGLDYVIGVKSPIHYRIQRVMERDGVSREAFYERANRQIDEEIKMKLCDFLIINNEQEMVIPQVLQLHSHLLQLAKQHKIN